jgi:hypothetical protein
MPELTLSDALRHNQKLQDRIREIESALSMVATAPRKRSMALGSKWEIELTQEAMETIDELTGQGIGYD